jgi:hypothetical protein
MHRVNLLPLCRFDGRLRRSSLRRYGGRKEYETVPKIHTLFVVPKVYGFFDTKACVIFGTFPGYSKSMFFNRRDSAKIRLKKRALF